MYIGYYVGKISIEQNNSKSIILYVHQKKLFTRLNRTIPNINIVLGHIQNFQGTYREKGVDVRMALDLYKLANDNIYDKAILISSDSDLVPAVKMAQQIPNKIIEYIGFKNNPSIALVRECNSYRLLDYTDIKPFETK